MTSSRRLNTRREFDAQQNRTVGAYPSGHARPDLDDLWTRSSKKRCLSPPDKTLIVRFVAGFFANVNSAIWFGLNLKQQLSEEERGHKTHIAKQDTSPPV